jgi:hypothetical protein
MALSLEKLLVKQLNTAATRKIEPPESAELESNVERDTLREPLKITMAPPHPSKSEAPNA